MRERKAMTLKWVQVVYNVAMVALAISMLSTMILAAWGRAQRRGIMSLICERPEDVPFTGAFGCIIYVFYLRYHNISPSLTPHRNSPAPQQICRTVGYCVSYPKEEACHPFAYLPPWYNAIYHLVLVGWCMD